MRQRADDGAREAALLVHGGPIYTGDPERRWMSAFVVREGRIAGIGTREELTGHIGPGTQSLDLAGRFAMPGLIDGHLHLTLGGTQLAWELPLLPTDGPEEIFAKVHGWTDRLQPGEWVIGGIIGSVTFNQLNSVEMLRRLDEASAGHPVLLRDDTMHNRLVNSAALEAMAVGPDTADPEGGR